MKVHLLILWLFMTILMPLVCAGEIQDGFATMQTGPRLHLDYDRDSIPSNPVDCFMYFIPLTSPTSVTVSTEPGTTFRASITSWKTQQKGSRVYVKCDFEVTGQGDYRVSYIPDEMIRHSLSRADNPKEIAPLLEWIRLDGPCLGRIDGYGKIIGDSIQMESVEISFTRDNTKSPIQVSIYDVPRVRGRYLFENRTNCQIARINSLTFNRNDGQSPRMSVEIASLKKPQKKEGLFSRLTAMIANILSTSTPVAPVGNTTMMDFGVALYQKKPVFTFPAASNIQSDL